MVFVCINVYLRVLEWGFKTVIFNLLEDTIVVLLILIEENELLLARGLYDINTSQSNLLSKLKYIIKIADEIEGKYTGDDLIENI
jgi:hypothetical protein